MKRLLKVLLLVIIALLGLRLLIILGYFLYLAYLSF